MQPKQIGCKNLEQNTRWLRTVDNLRLLVKENAPYFIFIVPCVSVALSPVVGLVVAIVGSIAGVLVGQFVGHLLESVVMSRDDNCVECIIDETDMGKKAYYSVQYIHSNEH